MWFPFKAFLVVALGLAHIYKRKGIFMNKAVALLLYLRVDCVEDAIGEGRHPCVLSCSFET